MFVTYFYDRNTHYHNTLFSVPIKNTGNSLHVAWWTGVCARHCCMKYLAHLRLVQIGAYTAANIF